MEIGFDEELKTPKELRGEMNNELEKMDLENANDDKVAPTPLIIPDNVARTVVRLENALILSVLTKNDSSAIKQAAKEAIEPSESDIKCVNDFLFEVIKRYAPKTFADPLTTAGYIWAANMAVKVGTVYSIKEGMK